MAELAREAGFTQVSASHVVSPLMKIVSRGDTTVVDAYLSPILRRYVDQVAGELPGARLMFMQSSGGLTDAHRFQGKDSILSGPAGGIVGMVKTAEGAGFHKVIGFDMGGTSTDVSHYAGELEREFDTLVAGVRMRAPMMSIHTIAAGGGSILHFDGQRQRVGPDSAGANPGPACYRRGGPLAVTDCNVMLGKIQPRVLPEGVRAAAATSRSTRPWCGRSSPRSPGRSAQATGTPQSPEQVAEGFLRIAVANMANAIKFISVQRGHDVTEYTLQCFGGAGGQHACLVADELGMTQVYIHPLAGVLSAYGMGLAQVRALREEAVERRARGRRRRNWRRRPGAWPRNACASSRRRASAVERVEKRVHLKYEGTDTSLAVPLGDAGGDARGLRAALPRALQLPHARPRARRRGRLGGGGGRLRRAAGRARRRPRAPRARREPVEHVRHDERRRAPPHARLRARRPRARAARRRAGDHRREERHHRRRARLGSRGHGAGPPGAAPSRRARGALRRRHAAPTR